jgi:hypothetical protein
LGRLLSFPPFPPWSGSFEISSLLELMVDIDSA